MGRVCRPPRRRWPAILVGRDAPGSEGDQTNVTDQLDFTARFTAGSLTHVLVIGGEAASQTNLLQRFNNPFNSEQQSGFPRPCCCT